VGTRRALLARHRDQRDLAVLPELDQLRGVAEVHLDLAADKGIIEKSGAWYSYKGERLGQGRDNTRIFLKENPDILAQVEAEVREKLGVKPKAAAVKDDEK